ncbi:hypothetical protein [Corallococcus coralloides]|uniref:hypothetical protein n=1 Tax=Corallococcus coralloides TaxID=184914 RepID=UPI0009FD1C84|nr:hypothetical protein [Corallococcus coralloides]
MSQFLLARLYRGQFPVSAATQETVRRTLVQGPQTVSHVRDGIDMGGPWKEGAVRSPGAWVSPHPALAAAIDTLKAQGLL